MTQAYVLLHKVYGLALKPETARSSEQSLKVENGVNF